MHDIGNVINRIDHAQSGAVMAFRILDKLGMPADEIATVCSAIGNHDEGTRFSGQSRCGCTDSRGQNRRSSKPCSSQRSAHLRHSRPGQLRGGKASTMLDMDQRAVVLNLQLDTAISPMMDYFEIFSGPHDAVPESS